MNNTQQQFNLQSLSNFSITGFLLVCLATSLLSAQNVALSGKVTDAAGNPLAGVFVNLVAAQMVDSTDAEGNYSLHATSISAPQNEIFTDGINAIQYKTGMFRFFVSTPVAATVSLYNLHGRLLTTVYQGQLPAGATDVAFSLNSFGCSIFMVHIKTGSQTAIYKLISMAGNTYNKLERVSTTHIQRVGASAGADWLQASKLGYTAHCEQLSVLSGTKNITLSKASEPDFGANVNVFSPSTAISTIQSRANTVFGLQERAQFGSGRYAFLFKPGTYNNLDVNIGFYTEVLGMGLSPDEVQISGHVHSEADWMGGNATCTFWRSLAGIAVTPSSGTNRFAVSQAAPFRRMHVKGNLVLDDGGWSSGGFIADSKIDGSVSSGSQQQWFSRSSQYGSYNFGGWNMVFVGMKNPPSLTWPVNTIIPKTPILREKPFLVVDNDDNYSVLVPKLQRDSTSGTSWESGVTPGTKIPLGLFYIAKAGTDNAATINAALAKGQNLLLTPGLYHLDASIKVTRPNTIVLGIGLPSLIPDKGTAALETADEDGIIIAGILVEATTTNSPSLVVIGEPGSSKNHAANPISIHDIFCRTGGAFNGLATCLLTVNSNNVIGDHFWLWRADHGTGAGWTSNKNPNGLIVNGNDVTIYGLFVEHCQEYQTMWNGENGRNYFLQCELPYDVPDQNSWKAGSVNGWAAYKVASTVTKHEAWGLGAYAFFNRAPVILANAFESPNVPGVKMRNMVTISLGGNQGTVQNVINGTGGAVNPSTFSKRVATYP